MIYLFAGHNNSDPGAVYNGIKESDLTKAFRGLVHGHLGVKHGNVILDKDEETNVQLFKRVKPGSGSVVCDLHFNASDNQTATGIEVFVKNDSTQYEDWLASEIVNVGADTLGIKCRGVKREKDSPRKRLGVLHLGAGLSVLIEICFMSNLRDLALYNKYKDLFAERLAEILINYDNMFT